MCFCFTCITLLYISCRLTSRGRWGCVLPSRDSASYSPSPQLSSKHDNTADSQRACSSYVPPLFNPQSERQKQSPMWPQEVRKLRVPAPLSCPGFTTQHFLFFYWNYIFSTYVTDLNSTVCMVCIAPNAKSCLRLSFDFEFNLAAWKKLIAFLFERTVEGRHHLHIKMILYIHNTKHGMSVNIPKRWCDQRMVCRWKNSLDLE